MITGAFVVVEIAYMYGQIRQHSNSRMAQTGGLDSYSMESWLQCIRAEVPRMEMTAQVCLNQDLSVFLLLLHNLVSFI
jgi:abortive infection bacteriophage resistance protein